MTRPMVLDSVTMGFAATMLEGASYPCHLQLGIVVRSCSCFRLTSAAVLQCSTACSTTLRLVACEHSRVYTA